MDLKKFKKFTNSEDKIDKFSYYGVDNYFEYLKVINVINYFTLEVLISNRDKINKWVFTLNDVHILDDKLTEVNKEYLKKRLENFVKNRYFKFNLVSYGLNRVRGTLYFESKLKGTVNTLMINLTINLTVLKDKMDNMQEKEIKKERTFLTELKESIAMKKDSLPTIYEDREFEV